MSQSILQQVIMWYVAIHIAASYHVVCCNPYCSKLLCSMSQTLLQQVFIWYVAIHIAASFHVICCNPYCNKLSCGMSQSILQMWYVAIHIADMVISQSILQKVIMCFVTIHIAASYVVCCNPYCSKLSFGMLHSRKLCGML